MAFVTIGVRAMLMTIAISWKACRRAFVAARLSLVRKSSGNSAP
jgi:hypothetical protein